MYLLKKNEKITVLLTSFALQASQKMRKSAFGTFYSRQQNQIYHFLFN